MIKRLLASSLMRRILSATVLIPIVVAIIWFGGYWFAALLGIFAGLAIQELWRLVQSLKYRWPVFIGGLLYMSCSFLLCYHLREHFGAKKTILFFALIWLSDIGAYFSGKFIGGPKMAGSVSPNKTWSGYAGAILAPAFLIFVLGWSLDIALVFGLALGVAGQAGDLMVSWFKRYVQVKDTGALIPGHGGVLDRLDSLMLSIPVYLALIKMLMLP